jgi:hypothetical protein
VRCYREIYRWDGEEISITPRPRDPRCFRVGVLVPKSEVRLRKAVCSHCRGCAGSAGPTSDDLDPTIWPPAPDALIDETVRASRAALSVG